MKTCHAVRKKLSAYQDGEMGSVQKEVIEIHLRGCESCRRYYEALLKTDRVLSRLPEIEPAAGLSSRIVDRAAQTRKPFWGRIPRNGFRWLPESASVAALAAAGVLFGTVLGSFWIEKQSDPAQRLSVSDSSPALTLASVRVFDAVPPGSLADGYLKLTACDPEGSHEKN